MRFEWCGQGLARPFRTRLANLSLCKPHRSTGARSPRWAVWITEHNNCQIAGPRPLPFVVVNNQSMKQSTRDTKASWHAVELFGEAFAASNKKVSPPSLEEPSPKSSQETIERIQLDNDRSYFLSGAVDNLIYDPNCVFADPFVSFAGRDRFVDNLANLGSFITKHSAKMLDCQVNSDATSVNSKVMVKPLLKSRTNLETADG